MNNLLRVRYVFDNEQSSLNLDVNNKIKLIKEIVQISQKVDLNRYDLIYRNKVINNTDFTIKEIIGKDQMPTFFFKHKGKIFLDVEQEVKQYQRTIQHSNIKNLKCSIYIENLPSRAEFYQLLERFMKEFNISDDYKLTNKTIGIEIKFNNPDNAYTFLKYLNDYKQENPIYTKMKAILNLDARTRFLSPESKILNEKKKENRLNSVKYNVI